MGKLLILFTLAIGVAACLTRAEQLAATGHATCRSYGAAPLSEIDIECRMLQDSQREQADARRRAGRHARLAALGSQIMGPAPPTLIAVGPVR